MGVSKQIAGPIAPVYHNFGSPQYDRELKTLLIPSSQFISCIGGLLKNSPIFNMISNGATHLIVGVYFVYGITLRVYSSNCLVIME